MLEIVKEFRLVHPENADALMVVTELPNVNVLRLYFDPENVEIEAYLLLSMLRVSILLQLENADAPIDVIELGIVTDFNAVHPENAEASKVVTELPSTNDSTLSFESEKGDIDAQISLSMYRFFILLHPEKALAPIEVIEFPNVTDVKPLQPEKA